MLDREFQLELLTKLSQQYPKMYNFADNYPSDRADFNKVLANIYYLQEHGLISKDSILEQAYCGGEYGYYLNLGRITKDGMDFLADDGGLRSILGTINVKVDASQMAEFLKALSELAPEDRQSLLDTLKSVPQKSIEHLIGKAVDGGLGGLALLAQLIQSNF